MPSLKVCYGYLNLQFGLFSIAFDILLWTKYLLQIKCPLIVAIICKLYIPAYIYLTYKYIYIYIFAVIFLA